MIEKRYPRRWKETGNTHQTIEVREPGGVAWNIWSYADPTAGIYREDVIDDGALPDSWRETFDHLPAAAHEQGIGEKIVGRLSRFVAELKAEPVRMYGPDEKPPIDALMKMKFWPDDTRDAELAQLRREVTELRESLAGSQQREKDERAKRAEAERLVKSRRSTIKGLIKLLRAAGERA